MQLAVKRRHAQSIEKPGEDRHIPPVFGIKKIDNFLDKNMHGI
jgi:hypothetical protein